MNRKKFLVIFSIVLFAALIGGVMSSNNLLLKSEPSTISILQKLSRPSTAGALPLGSNTAKVTLIEFGDYQCKYCHKFYVDTKRTILENFVNTGKVKFLFKDFPVIDLPYNKASTLAAEASYCAADQGKYWQYHDELYNNWKGENTGWITKNNLEQFANNIKIGNINQFSRCVESGKYAGVVADNTNLAKVTGITITPSFVILGHGNQPPLKIVGVQPYSVLENAINRLSV